MDFLKIPKDQKICHWETDGQIVTDFDKEK